MKLLLTLYFIGISVFSGFAGDIIKTHILDSALAAKFNRNYDLVIPLQDYQHMFQDLKTSGVKLNDMDTSHIVFMDVFHNNPKSIDIPKTSDGMGLNAVWMAPLYEDKDGFMYFDNGKIVNYKYKRGAIARYTVGVEFDKNMDMHSISNDGDSLFYYASTVIRRKNVLGRDTSITDFDFFEWTKRNNSTKFLFSASQIIPDSLLVPELFEENSSSLYSDWDIYHWNSIQKITPTKLLLNFAFCGFMQVDMKKKSVDWYWGNNGSSFKKITSAGTPSNPYYTHCLKKIDSGPFAGCYSYFENGGVRLDIFREDSVIVKHSLNRIFRINNKKNTLEIIQEFIYDPSKSDDYDVPSMALGSVQVLDNYVLVNLGMVLPMKYLEELKGKFGLDSAVSYLKNHPYPKIFLYDNLGKEIANYTFPTGVYCYSAWIKKRED
jgi:hypothetical protein